MVVQTVFSTFQGTMTINNCTPKLWAAPAWTLELEMRGSGNRRPISAVHPRRPFALIGSASHCDLRIDEPHVPAVAYLVCSFAHSVEIWPTAAIAFPRWGIVQPKHEIVIGQSRLQISHPALHSRTRGASRPIEVPLEVHWKDKARSLRLQRAVTIMGRDQPSMLRLQGQSLELCDQAIIAQENKLWLIDLVPPCEPHADEPSVNQEDPQVTCLSRAHQAVSINGVTIAMGRTDAELQSQSQLHAKTQVHAKTQSLDICRVINRPPTPLQAVFADRPGASGVPPAEEQGKHAATTPLPEKRALAVQPSSPLSRQDSSIAAEELASRVTMRLVSMKHQRGSRYRALMGSFLARTGLHGSAAASFLAAMSLLSRWDN